MAKYREVMMKERTVADDELRSLTQRGEPLRLKGENLQGAHLEEANLRRASVGMADLRWARLGEADLSDADLVAAQIEGAELWKTRLDGTRMTPLMMQELGKHLSTRQLMGLVIFGEGEKTKSGKVWSHSASSRSGAPVSRAAAAALLLAFSGDRRYYGGRSRKLPHLPTSPAVYARRNVLCRVSG
ncbi:hypothetical protein BH23GEM7_BH23GEM7_07740 [soil metagenome]